MCFTLQITLIIWLELRKSAIFWTLGLLAFENQNLAFCNTEMSCEGHACLHFFLGRLEKRRQFKFLIAWFGWGFSRTCPNQTFSHLDNFLTVCVENYWSMRFTVLSLEKSFLLDLVNRVHFRPLKVDFKSILGPF